ncbi:MAG TPA: hydrogenase maturation protease [Vicinamibacterales bacterium]|nr:hydrogenase maturation protease [Vicinamibacterales bacterium]
MSERIALLVLGLGNVLLEDDGVGGAAVSLLLDRFEPPTGVRVFDGGTLGLSLLPYLENADAVILVDAVRADGAPGTFVRLDGDDVAPAVATRLSPHQVGVADLLDGARWLGRYPDRVVLLGLVPASMELSVGLSPLVRVSLLELVEQIVEEAASLGFRFKRRDVDDARRRDQTIDVARLAGMA